MSMRGQEARRQAVGHIDGDTKSQRQSRKQIRDRLRQPVQLERRSWTNSELPTVARGAKHGPKVGQPESGGFRSTLRIKPPSHRLTSEEVAAFWPYLTGQPWPAIGPAMGIDLETEQLWCFDPWEAYNRALIPSTGVLIMGGYRKGKSWFLKRFIVLLVLFGRQAINTSDSKGEHVRVAHAVGGTVIQVGVPGSRLRINALDGGHRPRGWDADQWADAVRTRRSLVLQQIVTILNSGLRAMTSHERNVLDVALANVVSATGDRPTIRLVWLELAAIARGDVLDEEMGDMREAGRELWATLRRLTVGNLSGMFEDESTVEFDVDSPYTVFDTEAMAIRGEDALAIAQAVTQAWVMSVLSDKKSGRKFVVAREEGWRDMNSVTALEAQRAQQKLAGELGIVQLLVVHEGGDFDAVGPAGSKERELAQQLAKGFAVKISFAQEIGQLAASAASVGLTREQSDLIADLEVGECVVAIGSTSIVLNTTELTTDWERTYFDTSGSMRDNPATDSTPTGTQEVLA
ncbi:MULTISPECIES: hypothetical protein [unclassified Pseudoclavibacter]|uniref:hypothetical protein n=1 Tax=unclassified Pseudoclavibacter TaxID=2615177 RepID=UPI001BABD912|nr:hypothetical protein [Pseudoclavibacter sp. Marseille-Q4354]MBS3177208.1 hypothetical protein [Pseudoclavibacter sp. Marseille-Q4354]